jgi:radical SAM protein with 4Fe4S-binding SPASM domain
MISNQSSNFDNVLLRIRDNQILISSINPPFRTVYWANLKGIAGELGLDDINGYNLNDFHVQARFLQALSNKVREGQIFMPHFVQFSYKPEDLRRREAFRQNHGSIIFKGHCHSEIQLATVELACSWLRRNAILDISVKGWDPFEEWALAKQEISFLLSYLYNTRQCKGALTLFSPLRHIDQEVWQYLYERPRIRIAWMASEYMNCENLYQFENASGQSPAFHNLEKMSYDGLWLHIVLPVTDLNIAILPELVQALVQASRGATIEIVPAVFLLKEMGVKAPELEAYLSALLAIYHNARIPLQQVSPLSWITARIDSEYPLLSSPVAAGAEWVVLPNGDLYPAEAALPHPSWRMGNVLEDPSTLHWELLDSLPEIFSYTSKPKACQTCDWRYRCGGVDCSLQLHQWATGLEMESDQPPFFDLYCAPRQALFEEILWDSVQTAARTQGNGGRELIELHEECICYQPAHQP